MYAFLILFIISLAGIVVMVSRKLSLVRNGHIGKNVHSHPFVPDIIKMKGVLRGSVRRYGLMLLVLILRMYVRFGLWLKRVWDNLKTKTDAMFNEKNGGTEEREVNKFLKMISEYKYKVREIKGKIEKEEKVK